MKSRNKNRIPNRLKFGSRVHSNAPRVISMTRVSFDDNGQCIGTEQVQAKLHFDPRNGYYHVMIDDSIGHGSDGISDSELFQLLEAISGDQRATGQDLSNFMTKKEAN